MSLCRQVIFAIDREGCFSRQTSLCYFLRYAAAAYRDIGCPSFIAPLSPVWLCLGLALREVTALVHQTSVFRLFSAMELDYVSSQDHRSAIQGPYLTYLRRHSDAIGLPVRLGGD